MAEPFMTAQRETHIARLERENAELLAKVEEQGQTIARQDIRRLEDNREIMRQRQVIDRLDGELSMGWRR